MNLRSFQSLMLVCSIVLLSGCGGGGGGSATAKSSFYGGTWEATLTRVINDCEVAIPSAVRVELLVNQDGERVVVNSGNIVLTGTTNTEDGFLVTHVGPASNGCQLGTGYSFKNAGDGDADAGLALLFRCGARECAAGYGGRAVRQSSKQAPSDPSFEKALDGVKEALAAGVGQGGEEGNPHSVDELVSELADLVAPVLE